MLACGYVFKETVQFADRQIQVYEKPQNPEYAVSTIQPLRGSLQEDITDLLKTLNRRIILVDGFDKDHDARREWAEKLEKQDPDNWTVYYRLSKENKLKMNRINDLFSILSTIAEIKDQKLKLQFTALYKKLVDFVKSKNYHELSLGEKVLYMEEVDRMVMEIIDLLRQVEQGESSL